MWEDAEVISTYTVDQGIEDGMFVEVTDLARENNIPFRTVFARNLWDSWIDPSEKEKEFGQSWTGRAWDVLTIYRFGVKRTHVARAQANNWSPLFFKVYFQRANKTRPGFHMRLIRIKVAFGFDSSGAPVVTLMLPEED